MTKKKSIYVVESHGGEYEDAWSHKEFITLDRDKAFEVAHSIVNERTTWREKMPVPINVYREHIMDFDENEDFTNYEHYYLFTNHLGYSKEQWEESDTIFESNYYDDYSWTDINEYPIEELLSYDNIKQVFIGHYDNKVE